MRQNHIFIQRLIAYILLFNLFLQSCYNPSVPPKAVAAEQDSQNISNDNSYQAPISNDNSSTVASSNKTPLPWHPSSSLAERISKQPHVEGQPFKACTALPEVPECKQVVEQFISPKPPNYSVVVKQKRVEGKIASSSKDMPSIPGYKLLNCLYKGISSNTYRAVRLSDERPVVIKSSAKKTSTEKKIQCFQREFELGQQIHSPHVVHYLEILQDPAYGTALVMEDDQAVELDTVIPPSGFSNHEFLEIAMQIVGGLQAIHAANIIHNDLKLSNILIQPITKTIKIIDFNRASTLRQERQSATPMMVGTLAYISPEQTGRVNRNVDYRTDFYALGVIFYRLLCGQLPFTAQDALGLIHQHLAKHPLPPHQHKPTIALPLSQMVMKLLEKEAENRYQSCEGILYDLTVCQSALKETGNIPDFVLGQQDFSSKLTPSQHLYGRENEIKTLLNAFERVSEGKCEGLMVAGQPGVGKTMLIQEIQKSIALKQGYFVAGKFDQLNKNVAYSALSQAFNELIKQWLAEDETSINLRKTQLLTTLGTHASLLIKVIPTLALLIGEQPPINIVDINQAKNLFNLAFQEFVSVCASATHPLVIFLDDLQWADNASLELMTYLVRQPKISHLLWIGAYRDTEVNPSHPALQAINILQEASIRVQTLTLTPLPLNSLCQWIADSLHKSLAEVQSLAELIFQKTAGNPFFVKLFLQSLYDQQLLTFSPQTHWQWNLDKIRQHPATENVITLMTYQIQQLPTATQAVLSTSSCLGHRLSLSTLQIAMADSKGAICQALQPALNSGIMIQVDNELNFAHDRVQEAAYHLLTETMKSHMHLTIGQRLLASPDGEESLLFEVLAQFNRSHLLVTEPKERLWIAHLNLKAAQKAKQATAYAAALDYLHIIQDWVDIKALWQTNYSLAFTWHRELAEVEYLCGHFGTSETLIKDVQPYLQSILDKVNIFYLLIVQKVVQGLYQEAITISHQALQLLGSGLPLDNLTNFIQKTADYLKQKVQHTPLSSLLDVPLVINNPEKQALFKILASIYGATYLIGTDLLAAVTLMAINLSLTEGLTLEACNNYAAYGFLLCDRFEEYALGYQFGSLALKLAEKLHSPVDRCRSSVFLFAHTAPWSRPIRELPSILTSNFEDCLANGDIEYAGYSALHKIKLLFYQGTPLAKVQQEALPLLQFAQNTKNPLPNYTIQAVQRVVANLRGNTQNEWNFDINAIDEAKFEAQCQQANCFYVLCLYHIQKALTFYLYGHFVEALSTLNLAKKNLAFIPGHYAKTLFNWCDSLTRLALYPNLSSEEKQAYLQQVTQNQQQMQRWQASSPENFAHKYLLVKAELARIQGDYTQAEEHYDQAIALADRHGFIHEWAMAAELAAKYWLARGKALCAQSYLNIAFNGYKQWEAKRKLTLLKAQHADLLNALAPPGLSHLMINQETTLSSNTLKLLDLSSILKASHTISSEIELPKLLRNMMQIIIESAGAQQGTLFFVEADDTIRVQAEYDKDGAITTLQNILLDDWANGAQAVIQYVKRLHQSVVVDNATMHEKFKADPYISRTQAKSILCIPLMKHTELKAILYVENNLMSHAFNPERIQIALILTAQMAISLENARYFAEQIALTRQLTEQSARAQIAEESLHAVTHDLQLALQASKAGTWNWWIDTNKVTWDSGNCALFGLTPETFQGTYDAFMACVHPDDRELVTQEIKRCIEQDIPQAMEFRVIWPDKSVHVIAAQGHIYRNESGKPIKMAGVCLDATQRSQLEKERLEALKRAEEEERHRAEEAERHRKEQEEFIDTMCHEVRNPMTGIFGNVDCLNEGIASLNRIREPLPLDVQSSIREVTQKLEEATHAIKQCVKHQKMIVDDVLDVSKLEAGKLILAAKPFQPKAVIEEITPLFGTQLAAKHLELKLSLPETTITVQGDPDRFKIILINLISNALKFTEKGYIKISLQVQDVDATHVVLTFSVEDTGVGMTPKEQSRLFQRFSRPLSSQYEGSGLGLVITQKSLKLMGGDIQVDSEKGRGTRFTCHVTCETASAEAAISSAINPPSFAAQFAPVSKHILVVEDNLVNQKVLKRQIEQAGHRCTIANNGLEAVEKCEKMSFDLIFMDMEMPVMGGLEATRNIRSRGIGIPIVALSAYTRPEYKEEAEQAGMNDYLTKPYEKEKIFAAIQRLVK